MKEKRKVHIAYVRSILSENNMWTDEENIYIISDKLDLYNEDSFEALLKKENFVCARFEGSAAEKKIILSFE